MVANSDGQPYLQAAALFAYPPAKRQVHLASLRAVATSYAPSVHLLLPLLSVHRIEREIDRRIVRTSALEKTPRGPSSSPGVSALNYRRYLWQSSVISL